MAGLRTLASILKAVYVSAWRSKDLPSLCVEQHLLSPPHFRIWSGAKVSGIT
jgi:hypothetical protein